MEYKPEEKASYMFEFKTWITVFPLKKEKKMAKLLNRTCNYA